MFETEPILIVESARSLRRAMVMIARFSHMMNIAEIVDVSEQHLLELHS